MLHPVRPNGGIIAPGLLLVTRDVELAIRELEQATYDAKQIEHEEGIV